MFAALNSVEPPIQTLAGIDLFHAGEAWAIARRPMVVEMVQNRLTALEAWLDARDYPEDRCTAGDLLMTTVLRFLRHTDIVTGRPALKVYQARCEARPAFQKAMADHLRPFEAAPAGWALTRQLGTVRAAQRGKIGAAAERNGTTVAGADSWPLPIDAAS
jgi:glutathione S-transferase